jgi:ribosomal protein L12E/L44/L45/RPP1/RPP2
MSKNAAGEILQDLDQVFSLDGIYADDPIRNTRLQAVVEKLKSAGGTISREDIKTILTKFDEVAAQDDKNISDLLQGIKEEGCAVSTVRAIEADEEKLNATKQEFRNTLRDLLEAPQAE